MRNRDSEADVAHALATNAGNGDFDAALIAGNVLILYLLILTAIALIVADRSEDALAEESVGLGLEGTVVNRLRALNFLKSFGLTITPLVCLVEELVAGPGNNLLRRCNRDGYVVEGLLPRLVGGELGRVLGLDHFMKGWMGYQLRSAGRDVPRRTSRQSACISFIKTLKD